MLYALEWFFNGGDLSEADLHTALPGAGPAEEAEAGLPSSDARIEVEVTFDEVNDGDRQELGKYARGETVRLRRSWPVDGKSKLVGHSMQGRGFAEVRALTRIGEIRDAYSRLRTELPELPEVTAKEDILGALAAWEDRPENWNQLESVEDDELTHLHGIAGEAVLARRFKFILVPASVDIATAVGTAGKGSVLSSLIGALTAEAVASAKRDWEQRNQAQLDELESTIRERLGMATEAHSVAVTHHFASFVPAGTVRFVGDPPEWSLRGEATVRAEVRVSGLNTDVGRQGHGVQRALMVAVLQAMVMSPSSEADEGRGAEALELDDAPRRSDPNLLLALEEPEIYQHPVRARHFARVLSALATSETQVMLATHSPYFVLPDQFASLRRFSVDSGRAGALSTSMEKIATDSGASPDKIKRCMEREVPRTFSEGFFAEGVVLVEGDTDRVVIETVAERLGKPLDGLGVTVLAMYGKDNFQVPTAILGGLAVPSYLVADGDALGGQRKHPGDAKRASEVEASHKSATERLLEWLPTRAAVHGAIPATFGGPTLVTQGWTLLHDDLEHELSSWPSFLAELTKAGGELRDKNVATYRAAVYAASLEDLPVTFTALVGAITDFVIAA